jgi:hypothetical protein
MVCCCCLLVESHNGSVAFRVRDDLRLRPPIMFIVALWRRNDLLLPVLAMQASGVIVASSLSSFSERRERGRHHEILGNFARRSVVGSLSFFSLPLRSSE